jgi:glycine cleavage system protein P-like pyridoxal-binding family
MVILILGAALLVGCGESAHDRKVDAIIARLDAIEQKMYKNNVDLEKDIENVENDVSDLQCVQAALQKQ